MSSINSVGPIPTIYKPLTTAANPPKPGTTTASPALPKDPDHDGDGDTDGQGVDVQG